MIAAEAKLLTYVEAADRLNLNGSGGAKKKFIQRRVASGEIIGEDFGHRTKRISELNLQKYIERKQTLEKRFTKRSRAK